MELPTKAEPILLKSKYFSGFCGSSFWRYAYKEFRIMANLHKIRQRIIERNYYLSSHAEEEMLNDDLERKDVENAILKGWIEKKMTRDVRGTRYRIEGPAMDGRLIHVLCRFREDTNLVIVTVYAL